jgi:hypothetical protein
MKSNLYRGIHVYATSNPRGGATDGTPDVVLRREELNDGRSAL